MLGEGGVEGLRKIELSIVPEILATRWSVDEMWQFVVGQKIND